jgi:hypothetical protein
MRMDHCDEERDPMSGHRPFKELIERFSPVRKTRAAEKAAALENKLDRAEVAGHFRNGEGVGETGDPDKQG